MTKFVNGPAAGKTMMLKRAPQFLRVVRDPSGDFDALDQLDDEPSENETIYAYRLASVPTSVHVLRCPRQLSGWYVMAEYAFVDPQPDDRVMRQRSAWQKWCYESTPAQESSTP